ncbi:ABC-type bacteriocin/lantibiotic exporter, contains an N-terminal double-glycine peptidase domain [Pseudobutyrivibrio sp. YE44]|nr:ABC-type bacteriocin/lantibiotic exporter, contains an N-terminal double-glycine peptidase domain [Pseudobutyrivibrio sp. YE44]
MAQSQKTECGLTCVCMINRYYKNSIPMEELRKDLEVGRDGSSFLQIKQLLEKKGFIVKSYKIPVHELDALDNPSIILWKNKHFIVLEKMKNGKATVVDPAIGRYHLSLSELEAGYSGYAITPRPGEHFHPNKKKTQPWKYFLRYIFENKELYVRILFLSLIVYAFTLGVPIIIQRIIDDLMMQKGINTGNALFIGFAVLSIMYFIVSLIRNFSLAKLRVVIDKSINTNIFMHLLRIPFKFFALRSSGDIIYSLNGSLRIKDIFANQFITSFLDCGAGIVIFTYILSLSKELGIAAAILFVINVVFIGVTKDIIVENNRSIVASKSKVESIQMETVYAMMGIKMCAIEDDIFDTWSSAYKKYYDKNWENEKVSNLIGTINSLLQFASPAFLLFWGIYLVEQNRLTMGAIVAIYSLGATFFGVSSSVLNMWQSMINSNIIFERLVDIMKCKEEVVEDIPREERIEGNIKLKNVCFKYTKDSPVILKNINLDIDKGMKVAIVGKSGSGKSTLAKLLVGLYKPSEGDIFFDGKEIDKWAQRPLRRQMGIVPQDIVLFSNTIYDNIVMNRENYGLEDVRKACRIANIDDEIESMPMKYQTGISEMGLNISGGQRQRIALARAIIGEPKILLLDEATSSLDNINERNVSDEIKQMGTTQIVIAHRLSTIIDADLIVVLDQGEIVEIGKHNELIEKNGKYKELYQESA